MHPAIIESPTWRGADLGDVVQMPDGKLFMPFGDTLKDNIKDTFTRSDSGSLGGTWVNIGGGTMGINSNHAVALTVGSPTTGFNNGFGGAVQETGSTDHFAAAKITTSDTTKRVGLVVRYNDDNNFIYIESKGGSGTWTVTERINGINTSYAVSIGTAVVSGASLVLEAKGNKIKVWINSYLIVTYTANLLTGTKSGMWFNNTAVSDTGTYWDDYEPIPAQGGEATGLFIRNSVGIADATTFEPITTYFAFQPGQLGPPVFAWPIHAYFDYDLNKIVTVYTEQTDGSTIIRVIKATTDVNYMNRTRQIIPEFGPLSGDVLFGRASILSPDGYRYWIGSTTITGSVHLFLAREDSNGTIMYWKDNQWGFTHSSSASDSIISDVSNNCSIHILPGTGQFMLISKKGGLFGSEIHYYIANAITGPWVDRGILYNIPEVLDPPTPNVYTYGAKGILMDGRLIVFYNVNSSGGTEELVEYYGSKFVDIGWFIVDDPGAGYLTYQEEQKNKVWQPLYTKHRNIHRGPRESFKYNLESNKILIDIHRLKDRFDSVEDSLFDNVLSIYDNELFDRDLFVEFVAFGQGPLAYLSEAYQDDAVDMNLLLNRLNDKIKRLEG